MLLQIGMERSAARSLPFLFAVREAV